MDKDNRQTELKTPYYIVYEDRLRRNLDLISSVSRRADVDIIMAFKANAMWKTFPIFQEYGLGSTASSLNEMYLSLDYLKGDVHAYCPVYTPETFPEFVKGCSHITFNSISQFEKFYPLIKAQTDRHVSAGLRVNPQCSVIETDIYNPCLPGSRFGVDIDDMPETLPEGIEGLHFHCLCESSSYDLEKVLSSFELQFGKFLPSIKWLNMGGGHLMTRKGYDIEHLVRLLNDFHNEYPHIKLIMEPGSAFTWRTGDLVTTVLDVVDKKAAKTAIIDASFACHMPDCLEMPYKPSIVEAFDDYGIENDATSTEEGEISEVYVYRLGGNSCLSGDYVGTWFFAKPLKAGQRLTLEDMNHYTTVKTNMFNGIAHPSIYFQPSGKESSPVLLREFSYADYRDRMD